MFFVEPREEKERERERERVRQRVRQREREREKLCLLMKTLKFHVKVIDAT